MHASSILEVLAPNPYVLCLARERFVAGGFFVFGITNWYFCIFSLDVEVLSVD
jgi:hypothetical protein